MITHADVAQFENSMNNLGDSFSSVRAEQLKKQQVESEMANRKALTDLEQKKADAENTHYGEMEKVGMAKVAADLKAQSSKHINDIFTTISKSVADGVIPAAQGTQLIKSVAGKVVQSAPDVANEPIVAMVNSPDFELKDPSATAIEPLSKDIQLANGKTVTTVYNPKNGTFQVPLENRTEDTTKGQDYHIGIERDANGKEIGRTRTSLAVPPMPTAPDLSGMAQPQFNIMTGESNPMSGTTPSLSPTPPMPTPGLQEGQRVRNKRTGKMGTVKNGVVVPDPEPLP